MDTGVVDSENKAVQDAIALLFKKETGLQYSNEEPDMTSLDEEFDLPPVNGETLTEDILNEVV